MLHFPVQPDNREDRPRTTTPDSESNGEDELQRGREQEGNDEDAAALCIFSIVNYILDSILQISEVQSMAHVLIIIQPKSRLVTCYRSHMHVTSVLVVLSCQTGTRVHRLNRFTTIVLSLKWSVGS